MCWFLDQWCSNGAICQHWAHSLFFMKISSWPCVWNYTPGSKQGRLTEKKTAVRQWITVLWPDKCLSEEYMRKLGVCQESHTHTHAQTHSPSRAHIHTYCMQKLVRSHREMKQKLNHKFNHFYYLDWICKTYNILYVTVSNTLYCTEPA